MYEYIRMCVCVCLRIDKSAHNFAHTSYRSNEIPYKPINNIIVNVSVGVYVCPSVPLTIGCYIINARIISNCNCAVE